MPRHLPILLALVTAGLSACTSSHPPDIAVAPGRYEQTFDAARDTLSRYRFELERVDARTGVITTRPKVSGGLATPWDREQSSIYQELEDLGNEHHRIVRITFEPVATAPPPDPQTATGPSQPPPDLRTSPAPMTAHVEVVIERVQHAGWRLEPTAVRYSSVTKDPALVSRGLWPTYNVAFSQDPALARRLAEDIRGKVPATPSEAPAPPAGP